MPTLNVLAGSWVGKARIGLEYALRRTGPMSMAPSQLGAFTRSRPDLPHANLQYHVQPLSLDAFGEPLHAFPAFTASVCNLNPTSRGTVQIKSADFRQAPAIAPNYLSTPEDRQVAADSLRVTRRIAAQPALARYQPTEWKPGPQYESDEDLAGWPATSPPPSSIPWAPPGWGGRGPHGGARRRLRVRATAGAAPSPGCAWSMPAPCPPSPAATPIRPP